MRLIRSTIEKPYNELARAKSGAIVGAGTLREIVLADGAIGWLVGAVAERFCIFGKSDRCGDDRNEINKSSVTKS